MLARSAFGSLVVFAVVGAVGCGTEVGGEEETNRSSDEIVGGVVTGDLPEVAAINHTGLKQLLCTGRVIAKRKVLTAAHCLIGNPPLAVELGTRVNGGPLGIPVVKAVSHPSYKDTNNDPAKPEFKRNFDVAVLTLAADAPVTPVATLGTPVAGRVATGIGYGRIISYDETYLTAGTKRRVALTVQSVAPKYLLAGQAFHTTCQGDSGGPLVDASGATVGVVSGGPIRCEEGSAIYTRVDGAMATWIKAQ